MAKKKANRDRLLDLQKEMRDVLFTDNEKKLKRILKKANELIEELPDENDRERWRLDFEFPRVVESIGRKDYDFIFDYIERQKQSLKGLPDSAFLMSMSESMKFTPQSTEEEHNLAIRMVTVQKVLEEYLKKTGKVPTSDPSGMSTWNEFLAKSLSSDLNVFLSNPYTGHESFPAVTSLEGTNGIDFQELTGSPGVIQIFVDAQHQSYVIVGFDDKQRILSHQKGPFIIRNGIRN